MSLKRRPEEEPTEVAPSAYSLDQAEMKQTEQLRPVPPTAPIDPSDSEKPRPKGIEATAFLWEGSIIPGRDGKYEYEILRQLGRGGFGSVFLARCLNADPNDPDSPPEAVALKVFHAKEKKKALTFVRRELGPMLALKHDRIPKVYDWAITDPTIFVVMEYFPTGSVADNRDRYSNMEEETAWTMLTDLLSALRVAHGESLVHLDIKPPNVLIDSDGRFVLTDFGISQGLLMPWDVVPPGLGTEGYRSPEQQEILDRIGNVDDEISHLGEQTDLWGVGITMWSILTGLVMPLQPPYYTPEKYPNAQGCSMPALSMFVPEISEQLEAFVMSLLRTDRSERPASAAEALATIRRLRGESALSGGSYSAMLGEALSTGEYAKLVDSLFDPMWERLLRSPDFARYVVRFGDGELIIRQGEDSYLAYVLLKGEFVVLRDDEEVASITREGSFVGEMATLSGQKRTADVRTRGTTIACVFNKTEFERLMLTNPSLTIRLLKTMADRFTSLHE